MDRRYFEALELQKVEKFRGNALGFIEELMDKSGLVDVNVDQQTRTGYASDILRRSFTIMNARKRSLPGFEREVGFAKYLRRLKESLSPIKAENYSEDELVKYKALGWDTVRAHDLLSGWNITDEEFLNMVQRYRKGGMTVSIAQQIVLQLDCMLAKKK